MHSRHGIFGTVLGISRNDDHVTGNCGCGGPCGARERLISGEELWHQTAPLEDSPARFKFDTRGTPGVHQPVYFAQSPSATADRSRGGFVGANLTHTIQTPLSPLNHPDERCQAIFDACSSFRNRLSRACREANRLSFLEQQALNILPVVPDCRNPGYCAAQPAILDAIEALRRQALSRYANPAGEDRSQISMELMMLDGLMHRTWVIIGACNRGDYAELQRLDCDNWDSFQYVATAAMTNFERSVIYPLREEAIRLRELYQSCGIRGGCIDEAGFPFAGSRSSSYPCPRF